MPPETKTGAEAAKPAEGAAAVSPAIEKVLAELRDKIENVKPPVAENRIPEPNPAEERAVLQKRLGFNDDQMRAHEEMIARSNAPMVEQSAWTKLEKKSDIEKYRKEIEAEFSIYPQERRTPDIAEKIYYMVKGRHADSKPAAAAEAGNGRVIETRVTRGPGYSGTEGGMGGGEAAGGEEENAVMNDKEKFVANKLGVSDKDYVKSRNAGREIRELKVPDTRQANSLADVELRRLTGR